MRRNIALLLFIHHLSMCDGSCKHGRTILTNETGVVSDGENTTNYPSYARCEWLIDAKHPNKSIYLEFEFLDTECSYDFLFVFDGDSYLSPTLASLSGEHRPGPIVAKSGKMLVYLFSDRNYERTGFRARYSMQNCPFNCSGHGNCIGHQCYCFLGRTGDYCQLEECPHNCSNHGACVLKDDNTTYGCQCETGYAGYMCNISLNNTEGTELWYTLLPEGMGLEPRSAHAGAFVTLTECLYVFGGFSLNEVLSDLKYYCLKENTWYIINRSEPWPNGRYEHAIELFEDGFYMFGGILGDGNYSDELWYFNATSEMWNLCANESEVKPLKLSGHTLTRVEDYLYLFGGKTKDGLFWSNIYQINGHIPTEWQKVIPLAGKSSARRLVGHSTVYHKESKSLLVYGGYSHNADEPRYGSHKNELHMFHVENGIWSQLNMNERVDGSRIPSQRSFHSASIMGNYMVVFGGNTHIHHEQERCYDYEIYLYHLGCHIWVEAELLMGKYNEASDGRVSHVAAVAYGNTLLVAGGYAGYVKGDVMAFKFPPLIAPPSSEASLDLDYCTNITLSDKCQSNPDCFLCTKQGRCMHRTHISDELCGPLKKDMPYTQCPGICGRLSTCVSCLSQGQGASRLKVSPEHRMYIQPCNWCVKEAECQLRSKPTGNCASATNTVSGLVGWWNEKSISLSQINQCRLEDKPAGLVEAKYRSGAVDFSQPDEVGILRQSTLSEKYRRIYTRAGYKSYTRWRGFIHPLEATVKHLMDPSAVRFMLQLVVDNISVRAWLSRDAHVGLKEKILDAGMNNMTPELKSRADNSSLFPNTTRGSSYYLELLGEYSYPSNTQNSPTINEKLYSVELKWDGQATNGNRLPVLHPFSFEFLEPYSVGDCTNLTSCLACMTDVACGWCDLEDRCMPRNTSQSVCTQEGGQMMITEPSVCPMCDDHVECLSCATDPQCEWVKESVHCIRHGRGEEGKIAATPEQCPASCHERNSCSSCLSIGECAWCESLRSCLPFYDYVTRHRHGQCTEWIDREVTHSEIGYECRNCSFLKTCDLCMKTFNCGWCGNRANPKKGVCFEGDFAGPFGNVTCSAIVNSHPSGSFASDVAADWSYGKCPDVDECALDLATCHENASCVDTSDSYTCTCNRGYEGDGISCSKTCYYKCAHGECLQDMGEYYCDCNLGWTGPDCNMDCKCNGHSMCESGIGKCDLCLNKTTGPYCDQCLFGHYGDPTKSHVVSSSGCFPCQCNGHGNETLGQCNNITGECYCTDNTMEYNCEKCEKGYYGDSRDGGTCYRECDHGLIMDNLVDGSLGSHRGPGLSTGRAYCLWILMTQDRGTRATASWARAQPVPSITFWIEGLDVKCERDHVYVYDGIPAFIDSAGSGVLLGAFCGSLATDLQNVTAESGIMTVYFDADISGDYTSMKGFNASYIVNRCPKSCDSTSNQQCLHGNCVCADGYKGFPECKTRICATGYTHDKTTNSCQGGHPIGSVSYHITRYTTGLPSPLFDVHGAASVPVTRYGHTLIDCTTSVFVFGGRSLKYGLLNDIWEFNFLSGTWTEIKPVSSEPPSPRYFHAAACIPSKKIFFIFGGLVASSHERHVTSKEMWKFAIDARKWTGPIEPLWVSAVAGHTMTLANESKLVIIGGFSADDYFNDIVYVYDTYPYPTVWERHSTDNVTGAKPTGLYGHSAVYDSPSKTVFVYGGYVFRDESFAVSKYLFTYDIETNSWSVLQPDMVNSGIPHGAALYKYFHMAQGFKDHMVVVGGFNEHHEPQNSVLVYNYRCNYWHQLQLEDKEGTRLSSLVAASSVMFNNSMYIFGGIGRNVEGNMWRLKIPDDICGIYSTANTSKIVCRDKPGCSEAILRTEDENKTVCFSTNRDPPASDGQYVAMYKGTACDEDYHEDRDCKEIMNCSECVATYPYFKNLPKTCTWCSNCLIGKCIPRGYTCDNPQNCEVFPIKGGTAHTKPFCPVKSCIASTCRHCLEKDCLWTKGITRNTINLFYPSDGWTCLVQSQMYYNFKNGTVISKPSDCPAPCVSHRSCETCLGSMGSEGGSLECYWSVTLGECMPPAYMSLHCLGGVCGTLLQGEPQRCPEPCSTYTKCADCRRAPGCGWCAYGGENGGGVCLPGTLSGPYNTEMCAKKNSVFAEKITDKDSYDRDPHWAYGTCPPEDECLNRHHTCDIKTEDCSDLPDGFLCSCKKGYIRGEDEGRSICNPICHQDCVHGVCMKPDVCDCHFGYIGKNCSTKCECNGHSTCKSEEEKNICLNCTDNTQGSQCQECKPLYVGDPKDGGHCTSCTEFCHEHSDVCIHFSHYAKSAEILRLLDKYKDVRSLGFMSEFMKHIRVGPRLKNETICLNCQDHTKDDKCETCQPGYFRRPAMKAEESCMKCMCNGHSDMCNDKSGENCQCQNNTETKCSVEQGNTDPKCHEKQCAECKEYFLGHPKNGHQCYRTMTVSKDYCLDPKTQLECTRNPSPLLNGTTVFFVVQPKYVNVDIRITIDVTEGGLDVFFSPYDDTFVVHPDRQTGKHIVSLDPIYQIYTQFRKKRSDNSDVSISGFQMPVIQKIEAVSLNTFFTVHSPDTVLIIRNLQGRLVITLPNEKLNLKTSRFFMAFLSMGSGEKNDTLGNIYFRQDQPHIDLFVFFSVFFSCFFLFLAVCVLLWKTKQAVDARRNRQQRAREMLHMASRPFAKVLVHIDHPVTPFNVSPNLHARQVRKPTERTPFLSSDAHLQYSPPLNVRGRFEIMPIAMEPTGDGLAAVGTIVLQLPGGPSAPSHLCLASTLICQSSATSKHRRMHNV